MKISKERLDKIINAELDGKLIILPCKVGDVVYKVSYCCDNKCGQICCGMCDMNGYKILEDKFNITMIDNINKTIFLSEEEAKQDLIIGCYKEFKSRNWREPRWFKD